MYTCLIRQPSFNLLSNNRPLTALLIFPNYKLYYRLLIYFINYINTIIITIYTGGSGPVCILLLLVWTFGRVSGLTSLEPSMGSFWLQALDSLAPHSHDRFVAHAEVRSPESLSNLLSERSGSACARPAMLAWGSRLVPTHQLSCFMCTELLVLLHY